MAGVALHAVKSAAVHGNHGALHINEIVLAQLLAVLSFKQTLCHKDVPAHNETIIATLGAIYGMDPKTQKLGLEAALARDLTPGGAFALLVFFAFAMQCISTIAVVRRETGGWKWPILQFTYMSVVAYAGAFVAARLIH